MLIGTHHGTVVVVEPFVLGHARLEGNVIPLRCGGPEQLTTLIRAHWENGTCRISGDKLHILQHDLFVSAEPGGRFGANRATAGEWETFHLLTDSQAENWHGFSEAETAEGRRLSKVVSELKASGQPIRLHFGAGLREIPGFLNMDKYLSNHGSSPARPEDYFVLPYVGVRVPIPDDSVDYIFHEDFFEHIDQLSQIQFLSETLRILKPGAIHRINTPNLSWILTNLSDGRKGMGGVYNGELRWAHVALVTKAMLEEMARLVGYSNVVFNGMSEGISEFAVEDLRPFWDRDPVDGNIYADLIK